MSRHAKSHEIPQSSNKNQSQQQEHRSKSDRENDRAKRGPRSLLLAFLETRWRRLLAVVVGDEGVEAIHHHFLIGRHHPVTRIKGNLPRQDDRRRGEAI